MKPAPFDYMRPDSVDEALAALSRYGEDARILAGGQSLMAILNMRLAQPRILIDISRLPTLAYVETRGDSLAVGAAVTQGAVGERPDLETEVPLLAQALPWVGHYQTRNRGTICGSIAHADPSAELPLCLIALEGHVVLRAKGGRRELGASDFFRGMLVTARRADEMVESVAFPRAVADAGYAFREVAARHGDFALVACAAVVQPDRIRLAVGGVADRPVARNWPSLDGAALDDALNAFAWELQGTDDRHASARYRRELVRRIGRNVIERARKWLH